MPNVSQGLPGTLVRALAALPHPVLRLLVGRPIVVDDQELHVEAQLALRLLALAGQPDLDGLTPEQARARVSRDAATFGGRPLRVERTQDLVLEAGERFIPARLHVPFNAGRPGSLLVYFHGGGFVVGDLDTHDSTCRFLSAQAEISVLAVDYRMAPEHPFPAAIDDALAAFRWAVAHADELGCDPARIAVGGDSAGGNLAAGVARLAAEDPSHPPPAFQLLFYPWLDLAHKRESYRLFRDGFYLTEADLDWYRGHYLTAPDDAEDPRCSPIRAEDLSGVAPAYVATSGFDPLRDEGEEYAHRLRSAGVPVVLRRHRGLVHGFVNTVAVGRAGREATIEAAGALRLGLAAR